MLRCVCILLCCYFLVGCADTGKKEVLLSAEKMIVQYPDSAYRMLKEINLGDLSTEKEKADFALVYTESLYKNMLPVTSDSLIRIAYEYYVDKEDDLKAAKTNYYMGKFLGSQDSSKKATKYLIDAEQYALKEGNNDLLGLIYSELGHNYLKQSTVSEALERYKKARNYFTLVFDDSNENYAIGNIACCFLFDNQNDSAFYYYSEAKERATIRDDKKYLAYLNQSVIPLYFELGQLSNARKMISETYSLDSNKLVYYFGLSQYYEYQNKMDTAQYYLTQLLDDTLLNLTLKQKIAIYYKLRGCQEKMGHYQQAYEYTLQYEQLQDSLDAKIEKDYILKVEEKYRNEQLINQNYILRLDNNHKAHSQVILIFTVIVVGLGLILVNNYRKKITQRKQAQIDEYLALIEEYQQPRNDLMEKLDEKKENELQLKATLQKRLDIIKQLTNLSFNCGDNEKAHAVFVKQVKGLMNVNVLTQDTLVDLLEIVNINYYGIIDFLFQKYDLSKDELILCCFVSAGFTSQEMSVLYNITVNNVYTRCNRLGKKMNLEESLSLFIKGTLTKLKEGKHS